MAFFQSQPPREPVLHAPGVVLALIGIFAAIHAAIDFIPLPEEAWLPYAFIPARLIDGSAPLDAFLPFVSHMFLHGSWVHLIFNCLWLLAFGPVVVRRLGSPLFLVFFLLAGISGAAMQLAFTWGSPEVMIGASGGISGLMAAGFRLMRWPGVPHGVRLVPILTRRLLVFTGAWFALNFIIGMTGLGAAGANIAWQAHMGGYLFGFFGIALFDRLKASTKSASS